MPAPTHRTPPADLPAGDTQPEGDPTHRPLDEDEEDLADMDKFMPGEESIIRKESE